MGRVLGVVLALVVLIVIAIAGGVWYMVSHLDEIVKEVIETAGSRAAGVAVTVDGVELTLDQGRATVRGLRIANPPGFSDAPIFELGEITVGIDLESTRSMQPLVIDEVTVRAPHVRYELDARGGSNIDALTARMQHGGGDGDSGSSEAAREPVKMRVREFVFEKGEITADLKAVGEKERKLELPSVQLEELGGSDGATADEIGSEAIDALTDKVVRQVARAGVRSAVDKALGEAPPEAREAVKGLLDQLGH